MVRPISTEYRKQAEACHDLAAQAMLPEVQEFWHAREALWQEMADQKEQLEELERRVAAMPH